jgi:hypothetical protein
LSKTRRINPYRLFVGCFLPNWLLGRPELTWAAKVTYARLMQYAGDHGVAWPSIETLTKELHLSERQVRRNLASLQECKLIDVEYRRKTGQSSRYFFLDHPWMRGEEPPDNMSGPSGHGCPEPPDTDDRTPRTQMSGQEETQGRDSAEETQETASLPARTRKARRAKSEKPPPRPKAFSDTEPLGRIQEDPLDENEEEEGSPFALDGSEKKHAVKTRSRLEGLEDVVEGAKKKSKAQTEANAKRAKKREQAKKNLEGGAVPPARAKQLKALENLWRDLMEVHQPKLTIAKWGGKERGQAWQLVEKYDGKIVQDALRYVVENWESIRKRFFKGSGGKPTVGLVLRLHDSLVIEAQTWSEHQGTISEWEQWFRDNPHDLPSSDLRARYERAKKDLQGLGLEGTRP